MHPLPFKALLDLDVDLLLDPSLSRITLLEVFALLHLRSLHLHKSLLELLVPVDDGKSTEIIGLAEYSTLYLSDIDFALARMFKISGLWRCLVFNIHWFFLELIFIVVLLEGLCLLLSTHLSLLVDLLLGLGELTVDLYFLQIDVDLLSVMCF